MRVLISGVTAAAGPDAIGEDYLDADSNRYLPLLVQPVLIFEAAAAKLKTLRERAHRRGVSIAIYKNEMFSTGHDAANRVRQFARSEPPISTLSGLPCERPTATPTLSCAVSTITHRRTGPPKLRRHPADRRPHAISALPGG